LGRTVRHAKDYGSILLFDIRYDKLNRDSPPVVSNISEWIKKNWSQNSDIEVLQKELK
jgi:Rad3-related DNA helicase